MIFAFAIVFRGFLGFSVGLTVAGVLVVVAAALPSTATLNETKRNRNRNRKREEKLCIIENEGSA
jgi:hypothetical protein